MIERKTSSGVESCQIRDIRKGDEFRFKGGRCADEPGKDVWRVATENPWPVGPWFTPEFTDPKLVNVVSSDLHQVKGGFLNRDNRGMLVHGDSWEDGIWVCSRNFWCDPWEKRGVSENPLQFFVRVVGKKLNIWPKDMREILRRCSVIIAVGILGVAIGILGVLALLI